jgi:quinol monooxygenase YgiN
MSDQIVSLAILEPFPGKEDEFVAHQREFYQLLAEKGYSQDVFYRDAKDSGRYVHIRIWASETSRSEAQQDPDVHRFWLRLPELCTITTIYEDLERVFSSYEFHKPPS